MTEPWLHPALMLYGFVFTNEVGWNHVYVQCGHRWNSHEVSPGDPDRVPHCRTCTTGGVETHVIRYRRTTAALAAEILAAYNGQRDEASEAMDNPELVKRALADSTDWDGDPA